MVYKFKRNYIFKRGETYYFSKQIPKDVREHYSRSRMVICLKTQSESLAIKSASSFISKLEEYWAHLRLTSINLPASHLLKNPTQSQRVISDTIKLSEAMEQYCRLKGAGKADTFFSSTSRNINEVIRMFGDLPVDQYSSQDAGKLRDSLMCRGLTTSSVKRIFSTIRAVFNLSINERGLNCTNPFTRTFLPNEEGRKRAPISLMEIKQVQDECFRIKDEKRLIIALISDTGMRLSEALGLSWDDVFIEGNRLGAAVGSYSSYATEVKGDSDPEDENFAFEVWYDYRVTDNVSVKPAVFYTSDAFGKATADGANKFGALVQTTFKF